MMEAEIFSEKPEQLENKFDVLLVTEALLTEFDNISLTPYLAPDGFVVYKGDFSKIEKYNFEIIFQSVSDEDCVYLLRPTQDVLSKKSAVIKVSNNDFDWLEKIKIFAESEEPRVVFLVSQGEETTGLYGLMRCLITEPSNVTFRCVITDKEAEEFSIGKSIYQDQMSKNLTMNILKRDHWGTFVHIPVGTISPKEVSDASITLTTTGDLSTFTWIERPSYHFK